MCKVRTLCSQFQDLQDASLRAVNRCGSMCGRGIAGKVWSLGGRDISGKVWSVGGIYVGELWSMGGRDISGKAWSVGGRDISRRRGVANE